MLPNKVSAELKHFLKKCPEKPLTKMRPHEYVFRTRLGLGLFGYG